MINDLISIIVPVYNISDVISHSLDAIVGQTYKNYELILVNDGSVDNSISTAENYLNSTNINYTIISQENKGLSAARNAGINVAKGNWIICLDGDDYIAPETLEVMINSAKTNKVDCVFCRFKFVNKEAIKSSPKENRGERILNSSDLRIAYFRRNIIPLVPGMLINKSVYDYLRFDEDCKYCEDVIFLWNLLFRLNTFVYLDIDYYNYFQRSGSIMHSLSQDKYLSSSLRHKENASIIVKNNPEDKIARMIYPKFRLAALSIVCRSNSYSVFKSTAIVDGNRRYIPKLLCQTDMRLWLFALVFCLSKRLFYCLSRLKK